MQRWRRRILSDKHKSSNLCSRSRCVKYYLIMPPKPFKESACVRMPLAARRRRRCFQDVVKLRLPSMASSIRFSVASMGIRRSV